MQTIFEEHKDTIIDPKTQEELNKPLEDATGFNKGHEEFLKMIVTKLEKGELDPHNVQTLHNDAVYNKLSEEDQEKADLTAVNIMSIIRQIEALWKQEQKASFQVQNLVETVFQMKKKFEDKHGDVYII